MMSRRLVALIIMSLLASLLVVGPAPHEAAAAASAQGVTLLSPD